MGNHGHALVDDPALLIVEIAQDQLPVGDLTEGLAGIGGEDLLGDGNAVVAGESQNADGTDPAIEKRQISRLGSTKMVPIDVRLICATNADILQMVEEGNFRQDLLYRINTIEIHIPPLRERGDDVILLAEHFLRHFAHKYKKEVRTINREAKQKLLRYPWPGNVRELQHALERAVILSEGNSLKPDDFILRRSSEKSPALEEVFNLEELERDAIDRAMKRCGGNVSHAAELLGITRYALYRKLEK